MPATISPLTRLYLVLYNALSFGLWATCTLRTAALIPVLAPAALPQVFGHVHSPLLTTTQTLAVLEIVHSLVGIVRAPLVTTAMQVASRLLVVWGVMYPFGGRIVGSSAGVQIGDYAFLGCLFAWGITECIRYGFFVLQVSGLKVPGWWMWLRYSIENVHLGCANLAGTIPSMSCTLSESPARVLWSSRRWNPLPN